MIDFLLGVPGKVTSIYNFLTTNWTATRAAKVDYLTANVAVASTAVSNVDYTSGRAANLDNLDALVSTRMGSIKNIYTGAFTIPNASGNATATITAVNLAKTLCFLNGFTSAQTSPPDFNVRLSLGSTTTVSAIRDGTTGTVTIQYTVVEFN